MGTIKHLLKERRPPIDAFSVGVDIKDREECSFSVYQDHTRQLSVADLRYQQRRL